MGHKNQYSLDWIHRKDLAISCMSTVREIYTLRRMDYKITLLDHFQIDQMLFVRVCSGLTEKGMLLFFHQLFLLLLYLPESDVVHLNIFQDPQDSIDSSCHSLT